jgi:hypothetical protein
MLALAGDDLFSTHITGIDQMLLGQQIGSAKPACTVGSTSKSVLHQTTAESDTVAMN